MTRSELVEHMMIGVPAGDADHAALAASLLRGDSVAQILAMPEAVRQADTCEFISTVLDPLWQADAGVLVEAA